MKPPADSPSISASAAATEPARLTASAASALIAAGRLSCEELARSCLARLAAREAAIRAWLYVDHDQVIRTARDRDNTPRRSALHGLPWGVKDVFDTVDMPTTQNSPCHAGVQVGRDAAAVAVVRQSGSVILGKTDTVEFAASGGRNALSRNPYHLGHTPGGSSSGSAAAVADFHVPLAFGTQTGGSHLRPASFVGIYGLKPSWGRVSREGLKMTTMTLDTVGWYGRCVADLAMVAEAFRLGQAAEMQPVDVRGLRVGLCRSPVWAAIEPAGEAALLCAARLLAEAGAIVTDLELPSPCEQLAAARATIAYCEFGASLLPEYLGPAGLLAESYRKRVENQRGIAAQSLLDAYAIADRCRPIFDALFGPELDVVLTPSTPGDAPEGLHSTGKAVFNSNWTLLHVPCVGVPVMLSERGLPVGVTLVGPRHGDARLLAIAGAVAPVIDDDPLRGQRLLW